MFLSFSFKISSAAKMAWGRGAASGIDDLISRLSENDPKLQSLTILRFRRLLDADVEALSKALQGNSSLQELTCSSHSISPAASAALGAMLQHNRALRRISIGNSSWGDQVSVSPWTAASCSLLSTVLPPAGTAAMNKGTAAATRRLLQHWPRACSTTLSWRHGTWSIRWVALLRFPGTDTSCTAAAH